MRLDNYLKAVQELQAKAIAHKDVYTFQISMYHFTKKDGKPYKQNHPSVIVDFRTVDEKNAKDVHFDDRCFRFYDSCNTEENNAVLSRLTKKLKMVIGE